MPLARIFWTFGTYHPLRTLKLRRRFAKGDLAVQKAGSVVSFALAALVVAFAVPAFAGERGPIKIGYFAPLSGPYAQAGKDMTDGFVLF